MQETKKNGWGGEWKERIIKEKKKEKKTKTKKKKNKKEEETKKEEKIPTHSILFDSVP